MKTFGTEQKTVVQKNPKTAVQHWCVLRQGSACARGRGGPSTTFSMVPPRHSIPVELPLELDLLVVEKIVSGEVEGVHRTKAIHA